MSRLERVQKVSFWVAVVSAALGFMTSAGCRMLPELPATSAWILHPLLLALGLFCGLVSTKRGQEIDRERWQVVDDDALTSGERDYAHRRAERERRWASTSLIAAPLMLGYWMAYQLEGAGTRLAAQLLPVTAILGAVIGLLWARFSARGEGEVRPPHL